MKILNITLKNIILRISLIIILLNGVLIGLLKLAGINIPVDPLSLYLLALSPFLIIKLLKQYSKYIAIIQLLFILILLLKALYFSEYLNFRTISLVIIYISSLSFYNLSKDLDYIETNKIIKIIENICNILLIIAYVQMIFYKVLPVSLTELPIIKNSLNLNNNYQLENLLIYYPNGLYQNSIVFGGLLNLLLSIKLYKRNIKMKFFQSLNVLLIILMITLLNSRFNLIIMIIIIIYSIRINKKYSIKYTILYSIPILFILNYYLDNNIFLILKILFNRVINLDQTAVTSNAYHFEDYLNVFNTIRGSLLLGINYGEYRQSGIITDGSWLILLLEFGLIGLVIYLNIWIRGILKIRILFKSKNKFGILYITFILFTFGGIVNSFLVDKQSFIIIWVVIGLLENNKKYRNKLKKNNMALPGF